MPTALIVEDEPEANHLLSMLVQLRGYRTDSAYTGGEALEKVRQQPPDIVFLDLMLPDINGYEVCKSIKASRPTSLIPVVMVTARVAAENRVQSFRVGAIDYIPKPYTPDQIFQAMADADAWRRDLERCDFEGEIRFDVSRDDEPLRQIAQLRSLLVARSSLEIDAVCRIGTALAEIAAEAHAWGMERGVHLVAVLEYRLESHQLILTLRDVSGWLADDPSPPAGRWAKGLAAARFDEITTEEAGRCVTLLKRFDAVDDRE